MLTFQFSDVMGHMSESDELTSGMVGKQVQILVDESWKNLTKTFVFRAGEVCRTVDGSNSTVTIPEDVLAQPFRRLYVGVWCSDDKGSLVIPTVMAEGPMIRYGAAPTDDPTASDLPVWKKLQAQMGNLGDLITDDKSSLVAAINELSRRPAGNNGNTLTPEAATLLIQILEHALYETDQSENITALAKALGIFQAGEDAPTIPSEPETPDEPEEPDIPDEPDIPEEPEVTLTHITAVYTGSTVPEGTALTDLTGITVTAHYSDGSSEPVTGYTLSGTVAAGVNIITVTYGGMHTTFEVTSNASAGDTPLEPNLLHSWDFTQSLTDTVSGAEITVSGAIRDESGLHFATSVDYGLTGINVYGKTVEVEFGAVSKQDTAHGRCIALSVTADNPNAPAGLIWHNNGHWATYTFNDVNWRDGEITDANYIANSTVRLPFKMNKTPFDITCNGEILMSGCTYNTTYKFLVLGNSNTGFYNMTIKKLRIYEGA